jgi:hypothetical protein
MAADFRLERTATGGRLCLGFLPPGAHARVAQVIDLEVTLPPFGGRRWWLRCPVTNRRAAKLYLFPGTDAFCHRLAVDPAPSYLSQRISGRHRMYRRMAAIRQKLGLNLTILDALVRPKGMHRNTFDKIKQLDDLRWSTATSTWIGAEVRDSSDRDLPVFLDCKKGLHEQHRRD